MPELKKFSITGFVDQKDQKYFIQCLKFLNCMHIQKMSQQTNILVVNNTSTQKFKVLLFNKTFQIAQLYKNPIPCVNKQWVEDSKKKNILQPLNKYLITQNQMFLGATIAVCGFKPEQTKKIQKIIKDKKGETVTKYKAVDIIRRYSDIQQLIDFILASDDQIQRAKHAKLPSLNQDVIPLVSIQWLQDSLKRKRCKFPNDYAVNLIKTNPITKFYSKMNTKLKLFLQHDIMDKKGDFLENTVVHIDKEMNIDLVKVLKNLVAVCGGYWTDKFSSIVTHVLVDQIDFNKFQSFKKYGSRIYILRPLWLIDSMLLYNRLKQEDYLVRCFKITQQTMRNIIRQEIVRNNQNSQNSQNFNSMPTLLDRRNNINSNTVQQYNPNPYEIRRKSTSYIKTDIFKGKNFYFLSQLVNDPFYVELIKIIRSAGGKIFDKINSNLYVFVPLKDSPKNKQIASTMFVSKYKFLLVSHRWVYECVKKNTFIEPNLKEHFHFRAFDFNTPLPDFHRLIFDLVGFDNVSALRIRQLLPILGNTKINPNKADITHILCGQNYNNSESKNKIMKIYNENKKVQLINYEWIIECINQKKLLDTTNYVIKLFDSQMPKTPEKKTQFFQSSSSDNKTIQTQVKVENQTTP